MPEPGCNLLWRILLVYHKERKPASLDSASVAGFRAFLLGDIFLKYWLLVKGEPFHWMLQNPRNVKSPRVSRNSTTNIGGKIMSTSEPIRNKSDLNRLAGYFLAKGQYRNHVMIVLGSCTALRISDLLKLRWDDVYDFRAGRFRSHIVLTEKKTKKFKKIALCKDAVNALQLYFSRRHGDFIFGNGRREERPISRVQAWRIIHDAVKDLNIPGQISCHSLRKTFGYSLWYQTKASPVLIMSIFNHVDFEITKRYLGITQDEIDAAYLSLKKGTIFSQVISVA